MYISENCDLTPVFDLYADGNSVRFVDLLGLCTGRLGIPCVYGIPDQFKDEAIELKNYLVYKTIGVASERRECESYRTCIVRCTGKIVGFEIAQTGLQRKLHKAAELAAKKKLAAFIAGGGHLSLAVSGYQAVSCTWKCTEK